MAVETSTAAKLVGRMIRGHSLSRRERRQLVRTTTDVLRLVPFAFFVLIPFMEIMIPVVLKFFPNFLPTTYSKVHQQEERMKRQLTARIDLASFLQDSMENYAQEIAKDKQKHENKNALEAQKALRLVEAAKKGWYIPTKDVLQLASLFKDYLTLDGLTRKQLVALCNYINVNSFGSDAMLRMNIRRAVRGIKADDQILWWEGIDGLTKDELCVACQERGLRSIGLSRQGYERLLNQWLNLSVNKKVSPTLLILSGALNITAKVARVESIEQTAIAEAIEQTVINLEPAVIREALLDEALSDDKSEANQQRLASVQEQNRLIVEEQREEAAVTDGGGSSSEGTTTEESSSPTEAELSALTDMASDSAVQRERNKLAFLQEGEKDVEQLLKTPNIALSTKQIERLIGLLQKSVDKIEVDVDTADRKIGLQMRHLDLDGDGVITASEVHKAVKIHLESRLGISDAEAVEFVSQLDLDGDGKVTLADLQKLGTFAQQNEEMRKEKIKNDFGENWPDPRNSMPI